MISKIVKIFKNPKVIILYLLSTRISRIIPDTIFLKIKYRIKVGKVLNLSNPKTFNEKLQWLKLYDRKPEYTDLVDKYKVRDYIAKTIGSEYLVPLLGVYNSFEEINFDKLPNQFVLKPNHTSGDIFICRDKSKIIYNELNKKVNKWLKRDYYLLSREWCYKNIKPRIICEQYIVDESGKELKDYKMLCFNGKVLCSFVCLNRYLKNELNVDFYDIDWNPMPFKRHYPTSGTNIPKPKNYDKMIKISEKLSEGIPFVRIDFYEPKGILFFGEFTFFPGSGFEEFTPERYDYLLGSWLKLPYKMHK
jgi:hypothetical protein